MKQTDTLIIGASISGLACAASLQKQDIDFIVIEKQDCVAAPWRNHYERLHLHTHKRFSSLPYKKFGKAIPTYPGRQQVVDYLEDYQNEFNIRPIFNTAAVSVRKEGGEWITATTDGEFRSRYLIMATGVFGMPRAIHFEGMDTFPGQILHSAQYKTGKDFGAQQVLVVGFGNSACEIAIDLFEQGATPSMSVRSPVNVVPRDVLGIPIQQLSLLLNRLPPRIADRISAPLIKWLIGDLAELGLRKIPYGPLEQISRDGSAPVLDTGTIQHIRQGHIEVYDNIERIEGRNVYFSSGTKRSFDAIVAAIGYRPDYSRVLEVEKDRFEDLRCCIDKQKYFGKDGLYFCGYWISPTGQIREIASDAQKIAKAIARRLPR